MKILYVHDCFGALAGAEANVQITASELSARGHTMGILHGRTTGKGEAAWRKTFSTCTELTGGSLRTITYHALAQFQPDLVYVHKMSNLEVLEALVESGVPLVHMVHDHDIYCLRSYKYHPLTREICQRPASLHCVFPCLGMVKRNRQGLLPLQFASYADKQREIALNQKFDRMVVVTRFMRKQLRLNGFDPAKIEILAPVPRMGDPNLRSNFSDRNLILYAGQLIRGKGVDVLLKALARVQSRFECVILGEGHHRAYCERLAQRLDLADRVHFKGFIPQEELKQYYRECSVVAISSVWPEPIATIGLEVMRYGLPVVAFDAGGIDDWLLDGQNGFLVPWMHVQDYAARIDDLLRDKARARRMGEAGLKLVSERYDFAQYISDLENLFHKVIQEKSGQPSGPYSREERLAQVVN